MAIKKTSLTRKIIIGLGIPAIFVPGMILAAMLGWNWQEKVLETALNAKLCMFDWVCPRYTYVVEAISDDTVELDNGAWLKLDDIQIASEGAKKYLNAHYYNARVTVEYNPNQDRDVKFLLGKIWKEHDNLSASDYLINYGYATRLTNAK